MYSSKPVHKNKDLWTHGGISIGIGDPYGKKLKSDSRFFGKQLLVGRRKMDTFDEFKYIGRVPGKKGTAGGSYKSDPYRDKSSACACEQQDAGW